MPTPRTKKSRRRTLRATVVKMVCDRPASLTLEELADQVGCSVGTLTRLKMGRTPNAPADLIQTLYEILSGKQLEY